MVVYSSEVISMSSLLFEGSDLHESTVIYSREVISMSGRLFEGSDQHEWSSIRGK